MQEALLGVKWAWQGSGWWWISHDGLGGGLCNRPGNSSAADGHLLQSLFSVTFHHQHWATSSALNSQALSGRRDFTDGSEPWAGKACWASMWGFPREHIRISTLSPFLPDLLSDQQITSRKDILNFAFFVTWRVASSRHSSPMEGESLPLFCWSCVTDSLQSHASCQQRCWVEHLCTLLITAGAWPWGCHLLGRKYSLLGCCRDWQQI